MGARCKNYVPPGEGCPYEKTLNMYLNLKPYLIPTRTGYLLLSCSVSVFHIKRICSQGFPGMQGQRGPKGEPGLAGYVGLPGARGIVSCQSSLGLQMRNYSQKDC